MPIILLTWLCLQACDHIESNAAYWYGHTEPEDPAGSFQMSFTETKDYVYCFPVNSYPNQLVPSQPVPKSTRTQVNPYPIPSRTQTNSYLANPYPSQPVPNTISYPHQLVPKSTRTQYHLVPTPTRTQVNSYPNQMSTMTAQLKSSN